MKIVRLFEVLRLTQDTENGARIADSLIQEQVAKGLEALERALLDDFARARGYCSAEERHNWRVRIMKAESSAAYLKDFFVHSFENLLQATGLPLAEVLLLEEEASRLSPETFALAMAHAYERALAIQKGMAVVEEGLDRGAFHLHTDDGTCFWFVPQAQARGLDCVYATYGASPLEAKITYVLTHMPLPIPMDAWMREYR